MSNRRHTKPILIDLFCCEGAAAVGYQRAGFLVLGIDIEPRFGKRYQGDGFLAMSALEALVVLLTGGSLTFTMRDGSTRTVTLDDVAAFHASPPCQAYSIATAGNLAARLKYGRFIGDTRLLLMDTGKPWVIENVEQARSEMAYPILLCGRMFCLSTLDEDGERLVLDRHRLFEANFALTPPIHPQHDARQVAGVYGGSRRAKRLPGETLAQVAPRDRHAARVERGGGYVPRSRRVKEDLLGVPHSTMTIKGLEECIPPAYAEHIGLRMFHLFYDQES